MASTAEQIMPKRHSTQGRAVEFAPTQLKAPFMLRCAAFAIDYIIIVAVPVAWLIATKFLTDIGTTAPGSFVWFIEALVLVVNLLLFPLLRGQTIGKMIAGITIVNIDGTNLRLLGVFRRNVIGYAVTALTLGLGFILCALTTSGRSLHDLIGGTIVVRGRRTQI